MPVPAKEVGALLPARSISFCIDGDPPLWRRPGRQVGKARYKGHRPSVRTFPHPVTEADEKRVARAAHRAAGPLRFTGPTRVDIVAVYARPASLPLGPRQHRAVAPDLDNVAKAVLDGLQRDAFGAQHKRKPRDGWPGVIPDDKLVVDLRVRQYYAASGEAAHTIVNIEEAL